jgi:spore maturation protein CgeB
VNVIRMEIFEKNLAILRRNDHHLAEMVTELPEQGRISVEIAGNGEPTVKIRGFALHSFRDPGKEGWNWARRAASEYNLPASRGTTVLGFGLGYHLKGLAGLKIGGTVIEPDLEMFAAALKHLDLTDVLENYRVLVGISPERLRRAHGDTLAQTILPHPPALRLHPDTLGKLQRYGEGLKTARSGGLKILLVNPISGGSLPIAHYCAAALRSMGHLVTTFASEAFAQGMDFAGNYRFERCRKAFRSGLTETISRGVELLAKETRPDMVLALAQAPLLPETLNRFTEMEIPTAFWFVEDYRVLTYWRELAPSYTHIFGIQKEEFRRELSAIGVTRYDYLPTAAAPEIHLPLELALEGQKKYGSPLSFVGAGYHNRRNFFRGLADYPFRIWGSGWPMVPPLDRLIQLNAARIDTETCVKIFNASAINLNLHSSLSHDGVVPEGDFVNPRTFEIVSCGAFQLADKRTLLGELFEEGEMELFGDLAELRGKIDHYLAQPEERNRFAQLGRARVLREHTYIRRMEELLAVMLVDQSAMAQKHATRMNEQDLMREEINHQVGLRELLDRLPLAVSPTLADIYGAIREREGSLSRAEKIFLALKHVELKLD